MAEEAKYCGQPATKVATILAWVGAIVCPLSMVGSPQGALFVLIPFTAYILAIVGLKKENPKYMQISSIIFLVQIGISIVGIIAFIVLGIVLPESVLEIFQKQGFSKDQAKSVARTTLFITAVGGAAGVAYGYFIFRLFSNVRNYFLHKQGNAYQSPQLL